MQLVTPGRTGLLCSSLLAALGASPAARAQEASSTTTNSPAIPTQPPPPDDRVVPLPRMLVTATRTAEDPFTLPYAVSEISPADLQSKMPRTTPEALRELPSIMLQKTSHGQGSPFLRGFTGFRTPNLSDLTRFDIARSGEQEIPAFGLKPESFLSPEVGVKVQYERFAAEAAYYHTFMDKLIVRVPTSATTPSGDLIVNKENSGSGYVHGVELTGSVRVFPDWTVWANFTWMRGELDTPLIAGGEDVTEPVSRLMPTTVNAGLRWQEPIGRVWAEFAATFAERQDRLASNDVRDTQRVPVGGTPGYDVYHLRAGWKPCRDVTLTAALENLTDTDYRIHGSGANEPGRNFILTADLRF